MGGPSRSPFPAVTVFLLGQLGALADEASRIGTMAGEPHRAATLEEEHGALEHWAAEIHDGGCDAAAVADFARALRAHIDNERRILRAAAAASRERLSQIPRWRAEELFECTGGPTPAWPGEWLG
jgi:hypothetical protein